MGGETQLGGAPAIRWPTLFIALVVPVLLLSFTHIGVVDDAYITFRYSRNLLSGHGLVYNPGDYVEGVTNLAWTLIMAIPIAAGVPPHLAASVLGFAFGALALLNAWRLARVLGVEERLAGLAMSVVALCPDYWLAVTNGLEGGLYAALLTRVLLSLREPRPTIASGFWGGVLFATRPESLAFLSLAAASLVMRPPEAEDGSGERSRSTPVRLIGTWVACIAALTLWRLLFYGDVLPNSITAKSGVFWQASPSALAWWRSYHLLSPPSLFEGLWLNTITGGRYLLGFGVTALPLVVGSVVALLLQWRDRFVLLSSGILAIQVAIMLSYGGDWMPNHRLVAIYVPLMGVLTAIAIRASGAAARSPQMRWMPVAGIVALTPVMWVSNTAHDRSGGWRTRPSLAVDTPLTCQLPLARVFEQHLPEGATIGSLVIGFLGYELPGLRMHDMLGLADRHLARHGDLYWPTMGKSNFGHTYREVKPVVVVLHANGLPPTALPMQAAPEAAHEYTAFSRRTAGGECHDLILVRQDAQARLEAPLQGIGARPYRETGP